MLRTSKPRLVAALLPLLLMMGAPEVKGQDPMRLSDADTEVTSIRFKFVGRHYFTPDQLLAQMVTRGPSFNDRLRRRFEFLPFVRANRHLLDPIELQRDMARLRRFYRRNGFLQPSIDYPASQYRRDHNTFRAIITVAEGDPLTIGRLTIRPTEPIPLTLAQEWERLVMNTNLEAGSRYTDFDRLQLESSVRSWIRDRGYAFADVRTQTVADSVGGVVDLDLDASLGPKARIDSIFVEGRESVSRQVVLRELPFKVGDAYSTTQLVRGQRDLFALNLFRVALIDVRPGQPVDSTVSIRIRVREAKPRYVDARVGYSREDGGVVGATWRHRNFLGGARQLAVSTTIQGGVFARPPADRDPIKQYLGSVSINQPYFFRRNLSAGFALTGSSIDDPNLQTRYRSVGVTPTLIYEILPFRTVSIRYALSQAEPLAGASSEAHLEIFSQDVLAASLTAGRLDDYLNPKEGWIIRPSAEIAGTLLGADVAFLKTSLDAFAYIPISRRSRIALTLRAGRLAPKGPSRNQSDPDTEFRFDQIRYYAGGANDVRGWGLHGVGAQVARADTVIDNSDGTYTVQGALFEPLGGRGKLAGSAELLVPAPFLGSSWLAAAFVDFGSVGTRVLRDDVGRVLFDTNGEPLLDDRAFPGFTDLSWAAGTGLRLETPVGAVRFDIAYKLNPRGDDLHDVNSVVLFDRGLADAPSSPARRRLNFHLSIQRAF